MWGSWTPAKVKLGVSGCPRNCAEATCKDIGVVCVDSGYEIHIGGAAGLHIKGTELLTKVASEDEAEPEKLANNGFSEAFKKPFDVALLGERIRTVVEERRENM